MKWFKNMKISMKLITSFLLVSAVTALVGIVGIVNMGKMNTSIESLYQKETMGMSFIKNANVDLLFFNREQKNFLLASTAADRDMYRRNMDKYEKLLKDDMDKAKPLLYTDKAKALYDDYKNKWIECNKINNEIIALATKQGLASSTDAAVLSQTKERKAVSDLDDTFSKLSKLKDDEGKQLYESAGVLYSESRNIMIIAILLGTCLGIGIGFALSRILGKSIAECMKVSNSIAEGRLDVQIDTNGKDETGQLMVAMSNIVQKFKAITTDINLLSDAAVQGKLSVRADTSRHEGDYKKILQAINDTLDAVIGPLNVSAEYVGRISKGDIPPKITDEYKGDFNEIKNNLNSCITAINSLVSDANELEFAAVEGKLTTRADLAKHSGEYRKIVEGVNNTLDAVIGPLNVSAEYVDRISKGDIPPKITDEYKGDFNEIKNNLNLCIDSLNSLIDDMAHMSQEHDAGDIDAVIPEDKFQGAYRTMAKGVNDMVMGHISVKKKAMACIAEFGRGNFDANLEKFPGKKAFINETIEKVRDNLKEYAHEVNTLIEATKNGKLDTRGNAAKFVGDWNKMVAGINELIDAFVSPINVTAEYIDRISKGDIPPRITDEYKGDFNEIKNNLNLCIDSLNSLIAEMAHMSQEHDAGDIDVVIPEDKFQGAYRTMAKGVDDMVMGHISVKKKAMACIAELGRGNFDANLEKFPGKKAFINETIEKVRDNLKEYAHEVNTLIEATKNGKLDARGNAAKFVGDWNKMVAGINELIDAFVAPINVTAEYIDRISKGDIPPRITDEYKGDFNEIKNNLNATIDMMNNLLAETDKIIAAAANGELDRRADANLFVGGWNKLVAGVNDTITNIVEPLMVTADYVEKVAKGVIPPTITTEYKGQYNVIKNNLNAMVKMMNELLAETDKIIAAAANGELDRRADANLFVGGWNKLVAGVNDTITNIVAPLMVTADYVEKVAKGVIPPAITTEYKGQYNTIKNNLHMLIDAMNEITSTAEEIAAGNLTVKVKERSGEDKLMQALAKMVDGLTDIMSNIQAAAGQVMAGSQEISSSAEELSQGSTEQSASVEEVSSSMEQMAANIKQNSDNAQQTEKIALKAADDGREGGKSVSETVAAMKEIAGKISIIEEIARQTNLLALNAAIEAARAGEHGKGFAVVASEVRKLAERSQTAAGEINKLSASSVQIAERAGEMLTRMVPDIQRNADLVQEIAAASNEQSAGANQINKAIQQLDQVVQQNAAASEEMASTSVELLSQAEQLQNTIAFFKFDGASSAARTNTASSAKQAKAHRTLEPRPDRPAPKKANGHDHPEHGIVLDLAKGAKADFGDGEFERY